MVIAEDVVCGAVELHSIIQIVLNNKKLCMMQYGSTAPHTHLSLHDNYTDETPPSEKNLQEGRIHSLLYYSAN